MKHINKVINSLQQIDANHISYDHKGRLLINLNAARDKPLKKIQFKNNIMLPMLVHPEDRIIRKNISVWLQELINSASLLTADSEIDFDALAVLFNLSSLVMVHLGKFNFAERLCRKQINYFIQQSKYDFSLLKYIIQPWFNMSRLDRINANFSAALKKITILQSFINDPLANDFFACNQEYFLQAIAMDKIVQQVIKTCLILEPIKTHLSAKAYYQLKNLSLSVLEQEDLKALHGFAYEAVIIAFVNIGQYEHAMKYCEYAINDLPPHLLHIFLLRQAELFYMANDKQYETIFMRLVRLLDYIDQDAIDVNKTLFALKTAQQMQVCNAPQMAYIALIKTLYFAKQLEDEYLIIETLMSLVNLGAEPNYVTWLEDLTNTTGYAAIHNKLPNKSYVIPPKLNQQLALKSKKIFNQLMMI